MKKILISLLILAAIGLALYYAFPGAIVRTASNITISNGGFKKHQLVLNGENYFYYDNEHEDKPVVIFLHGFSDRKESWFPFVNKLSPDYHIIVPDLMGHGENDRNMTRDYSFASQAIYLKSFTEALELKQIDLVGISMGGGIAGKFAAKYPDVLHSLTLISTAGINGYANPSRSDEYMQQFKPEDRLDNIPMLPKKLDRKSMKLFKEYIFEVDIFLPNRLFKYYLGLVLADRDFYVKVLKDFVSIDTGKFIEPMDDYLSMITCPVLVIWGKQDPLLDVSCVPVIEKGLPSPPTVDIIDNCGHATIVEQPELTLKPIADFLRSAH